MHGNTNTKLFISSTHSDRLRSPPGGETGH